MKYNNSLKGLRPRDIINARTIFEENVKYLILNVSLKNNSIRVLSLTSIDNDKGENSLFPGLEMPFSMILDYEKIDSSELLFYSNYNNPHIINAISQM
tara:strand:+ start:4804 stop:5097 length:294 start_codon:yes stop_codon:yes gene_type:complete